MLKSINLFLDKGFNFENYNRNKILINHSSEKNKNYEFKKTGTTICGCIYKDGVILGADTRATAGSVVADKNCFKIHRIADTIYCCGAGTAADCDHVTRELEKNVEFQSLEIGKKPRIISVLTQAKRKLFQYQGHIGAYLIIAGMDVKGPGLFTCYAYGSTDSLPYVTMGSGSLAAMSILENSYRLNLGLQEAKKLVISSIKAGIMNDLGSGSNVDICVITTENSDLQRSIYSTKRADLDLKNLSCGLPTILIEEVLWEDKKMETD